MSKLVKNLRGNPGEIGLCPVWQLDHRSLVSVLEMLHHWLVVDVGDLVEG